MSDLTRSNEGRGQKKLRGLILNYSEERARSAKKKGRRKKEGEAKKENRHYFPGN